MDKEVEEGMRIVATPPQKLIARCARFLRLEEMDAPEIVIDEERRLIMKAVLDCKPEEIARSMRDFASEVARHERIAREVDAEYPVYPED